MTATTFAAHDIPDDIRRWNRRRAVLHLSRITADPAAIGAILKIRTGNVATVMSSLRKEGHDIPRRSRARARPRAGALAVSAVISGPVADRLSRAAENRDERVNDLASRILTTVLMEDLISAVLDDGGEVT